MNTPPPPRRRHSGPTPRVGQSNASLAEPGPGPGTPVRGEPCSPRACACSAPGGLSTLQAGAHRSSWEMEHSHTVRSWLEAQRASSGMWKIYRLKMCTQTAAPSSLRKHMCCGLTVGGLGGTPRAWHKLSWGPRVDMHGSRAVNLVTNTPSWSCRDRENTGTLKAAPSGRREPAGKLTHTEPLLGGQGAHGEARAGRPRSPGSTCAHKA